MEKKVLLIGGNGLVGQSIALGLDYKYQIISTAGHHVPKNGYRLMVEEPNKLVEILNHENPEIVISSIRGNYQSQMSFHQTLADWLTGKKSACCIYLQVMYLMVTYPSLGQNMICQYLNPIMVASNGIVRLCWGKYLKSN